MSSTKETRLDNLIASRDALADAVYRQDWEEIVKAWQPLRSLCEEIRDDNVEIPQDTDDIDTLYAKLETNLDALSMEDVITVGETLKEKAAEHMDYEDSGEYLSDLEQEWARDSMRWPIL